MTEDIAPAPKVAYRRHTQNSLINTKTKQLNSVAFMEANLCTYKGLQENS